jgi:hypothetical protein
MTMIPRGSFEYMIRHLSEPTVATIYRLPADMTFLRLPFLHLRCHDLMLVAQNCDHEFTV